ncbi:MAG: FAD-binding dehydrogenase [Actinobacteria bacterium]|nr:FAD-binding dehydrogenase [Actinomycetota bacterium]
MRPDVADRTYRADAVVVGAGLAGLVAATELADAGRRVLVVDQEPESSLGGQAHWSFGGLFLVDTPEQRRLGIRDTHETALADWFASAEFTDDADDEWPKRWAEAYVAAATGELYPWLRDQGVRFFPVVQWAERGGYLADGPGNSAPRFHITWGTGPGLLEPFVRRTRAAEDEGRIRFAFRHRVTEITSTDGTVDGVAGEALDGGAKFTAQAGAVLIATGGIGGNHDLVRRLWPADYGEPPEDLLQGVPDHVDGSGLLLAQDAGANVTNIHRMWNYPEGIPHHTPVWSRHAVRILNGPSTLWFDALGRRLPPPLFPGFDTLRAFEHIVRTGYDHSWYVANRRIVTDEFSLSGSVHNPDLTGRDVRLLLTRSLPRPFGPVQRFMDTVPDFVQAGTLSGLVRGMNALTGRDLIDEDTLRDQIVAYDRQVALGYGNDAQLSAIATSRNYLPDKLMRTASSPRILDPDAHPLIAVRLRVLTRKSLGGLQTDLSGRVLRPDGDILPGLYAAGEVSGFGGGGYHGRRSLEGTFLGGCLFSGRRAATGMATDTA